MTDLATLAIAIDATQADQAAAKLDALAVSGAKAEAATAGLTKATVVNEAVTASAVVETEALAVAQAQEAVAATASASANSKIGSILGDLVRGAFPASAAAFAEMGVTITGTTVAVGGLEIALVPLLGSIAAAAAVLGGLAAAFIYVSKSGKSAEVSLEDVASAAGFATAGLDNLRKQANANIAEQDDLAKALTNAASGMQLGAAEASTFAGQLVRMGIAAQFAQAQVAKLALAKAVAQVQDDKRAFSAARERAKTQTGTLSELAKTNPEGLALPTSAELAKRAQAKLEASTLQLRQLTEVTRLATSNLNGALPDAPKTEVPRASRIGGSSRGSASSGGRRSGATSAANDSLGIDADAVNRDAEAISKAYERQMEIGKRFADEIDLENQLRRENVKQQQVSIALHALEAAGVEKGSLAYAMYAEKITAAAEARGQDKLDLQNAHDYADAMSMVADNVRNATRDFGDLFGTAGQGFANLANEMAGYAAQQAALNEQLRAANADGEAGAAARARITAEMANAEVDHYGNILSASKTFFNQKSKAYKALEAAERAYRLYQAASAVIEALHVGKSIALDAAKTASSVTNSATRASADGVAAFAKTLASLPFPLNLVAGAAVLAALVAVGVKIAGGGHKASAAASSTDTRPDLTSDAQTSPYSTLPGAGGLYEPKNAALAAPKSNVVYPQFGGSGNTVNYNINAPGADAGTVDTIRNILDQHQQQTVDMARAAAAQDQYMNLTRQRIGGGA